MTTRVAFAAFAAVLLSGIGFKTLPASAQQAAQPTPDQLWNLRLIGVDKALARGFTGRGFTIGIVDDIIQFDHPEFAGRWLGGIDIFGNAYIPRSPGPNFGLLDFHGTHVAGTAAGANVGVARGASLVGVSIFHGVGDFGALIGSGYRFGLDRGVRAFNNSWSERYSDPRRTITTADVSRADIEAFRPGLLQAFRDVSGAGAIQVFTTGNFNLAQPSYLAGMPFFFPELQPTWLAVTAVGPDRQRASYANACGVAAQWCLAAPGGDGPVGSDDAVWSAWPGSQYYSIGGTSMAAPAVTGALAVASEIFPQATGAELTQLILQTATDIGAPGVDAVYGWGLLNLGNVVEAVNPETATTLANVSASGLSTLQHVGTAIPLPSFGAAPVGIAAEGSETAYASLGVGSDGGSLAVNSTAFQGVWATSFYGHSVRAGTAGSSGAKSGTGGFLAGVDLWSGPTYRMGVAAGLSWTGINMGAGDSANSDGVHLLVYGDWQNNGWFASGVGQIAFFEQSITRSRIAGAEGTSATPRGRSSASSTALELSLRAGYGWAIRDFEFAPYVAVAGRWQNTGAFAETGAGIFSLSVASSTLAQFEIGPGVRLSAPEIDFDAFTVRPSLDVAYAHLSGDRAHETTASLLGTSIRARTAELGEHVFKAGSQIKVTGKSGRTSGFLSYDGRFQNNATAHTVSAGFRLSF